MHIICPICPKPNKISNNWSKLVTHDEWDSNAIGASLLEILRCSKLYIANFIENGVYIMENVKKLIFVSQNRYRNDFVFALVRGFSLSYTNYINTSETITNLATPIFPVLFVYYEFT